MNSDGTNLTRITTGANAYFPTWSPNGTQIAYNTAALNIEVMNADGTHPRQIYSGGNSAQPIWSTKTNLIAFNANPPGGPPARIFVMKPDGTDLHVLNTGSIYTERDPSWHP